METKRKVFKILSKLGETICYCVILFYLGIMCGTQLVDKSFLVPTYVSITCALVSISGVVASIVFDMLYTKSNIITGGAK